MASRTIEQRRTILLSNLGFVCFIGKRKNNTTNTKRQMKKGDRNFIAHIFTYSLLIVITVIWDFLLFKFKNAIIPLFNIWMHQQVHQRWKDIFSHFPKRSRSTVKLDSCYKKAKLDSQRLNQGMQ